MTYCVGMLIDAGLIMMADTRTNAGVDNISSFRKLHVYESDDRHIFIASAGNLSVTQATISKLEEGVLNIETEQLESLQTVPSIFRAVELIGKVLRETQIGIKTGMKAESINFGANLLVGGRVGNEELRLYLVYDIGNSIRCGKDTPFLQIGELKYGKPILDRALSYDTPFNEAVKIALISFDSTMRSNLAVGLPIDIIMLRNGEGQKPVQYRVERNDPYFKDLSESWGDKLKEAQASIPRPPFVEPLKT